MSLSELSIRRPVFAWMLMMSLVVFGAISFQRMGISQLPDVDFPVINVALSLENAAPAVMESDVVDPIEDAVMGIEGIRTVYSSSSQGSANITVEFDLGRNIDVSLQEVQTRIAQAQRLLPKKLDPPVITKTNPEDQPILWLMLTNTGSLPLYQQMIYARNVLKDQFTTVSGVGNVVFGGYVDPNLRVWLTSSTLNKYQMTSDDILNAIQNEQIEQPEGRIENPQKEYNVRLMGEASTPEDFGKIRINQRGGGPNYSPIQLNQIAQIEEGLADIRAISRYNGKEVVGLGIVKQRGSNAVKVAELVADRVSQIRTSLPPGMSLDVRLDTTRFIRDSVSELNYTLLLSAVLTSVVCYFFLGSWSSTLNVLFAIPTSIVGAFIVLYFYGFTLNTFTLLGLTLAIGIVVDDAIMMLENIVRHAEMGKDKRTAALEGSNEITFAAIAATIAIAAIFIPVIFMKGIIGRFFYQYGITVTAAVGLSLLEALTLTPMRCSKFLQVGHLAGSGRLSRLMTSLMDDLANGYQKSLVVVLNHRWKLLAGSTLFFIGSLLILIPLRKELLPEQDQSLFLLVIKAPVGSSITATDLIFKKAEKFLSEQKDVKEYYTSIGNYQGSDIVNTGVIYVTLTDPKSRTLTQRQEMDLIRDELQKNLSGAEVYAQDPSLAGFSSSRGYPIEFSVQGPHWESLEKHSQELISQLKSTGLFVDLNTDYQAGMPEIQIVPDRDQAAKWGVSVTSMGNIVGTFIGGSIFTSSTQYPKGGHRYDIRVRSLPEEHQSPSDINRVRLPNNRGSQGELVPIERVVHTYIQPSLQLISRQNRERAIPVFSNIFAGKSQLEALKVLEQISKKVLPEGYHISITGSAQTFRESFDSLVFALILGIVISYMVLASQFNSFIHPITVLMALPFSVSGAFVALFLTHQSLNLFSMIGLILLMGIVKKNSILLVDFTNHRRDKGDDVRTALLEACPVRLRPILMTSIATIAGAIPAALALGPGAETRIPMAVSIIGGVFVSTFLTLFVVPCVYSLFSVLERNADQSES